MSAIGAAEPTTLAIPSGVYGPDRIEATDALDPTRDLYGDLNHAFRFFNERLFAGGLQPTLITLRATGRTYGYFAAERFVDTSTGRRVHEIAFNPETFAQRGIEDVLSTLVHEQVHLLQYQDGSASRRAYHNKDFEKKMRAVGLVPSSTGQPGGPSVGEKMTHYVDIDGPFLVAARELVDNAFRLRWSDRFISQRFSRVVFAKAVPGGLNRRKGARAPEPPPPATPAPAVEGPGAGFRATPAPAEVVDGLVVLRPQPQAKPKTKTKHVCPGCKNAAWGKPSLNLVCGDCDLAYRVAEA